MNPFSKEIMIICFLTVQTIILKSMLLVRISRKAPKEKRTDPIIGQALLLDSDLVPLAMEMYPGNEEKPYIRKIIEDMKQRHRVSGRTVQVADKGLNCARNIRAAIDGDGYIF